MKILKYNLCTRINRGTEEVPVWEDALSPVIMGWSEANEELVKQEAYNGEYTIEDDGEPEPVVEPTDAERIAELEEALALLLSGVVE